jgi:hypothetical protein
MFNTHDPSLWIDNDLILLVLLLPLYSTTLFVTLVARGRGRHGRTDSGRRIGMVIVGMGVVEFLVFQLVIFVVVLPARFQVEVVIGHMQVLIVAMFKTVLALVLETLVLYVPVTLDQSLVMFMILLLITTQTILLIFPLVHSSTCTIDVGGPAQDRRVDLARVILSIVHSGRGSRMTITSFS